jgi:hypothetical protein
VKWVMGGSPYRPCASGFVPECLLQALFVEASGHR